MKNEKDFCGIRLTEGATTSGLVPAESASHAAPWRAVNHPYCGRNNETLDDWGVEDATGERIVEVYESDGLDEPRLFPTKARASLIAAAPEMKAALRVALAHVSELRDAWARGIIREGDALGGTRSNRNVDVESLLIAALAKSEGQ